MESRRTNASLGNGRRRWHFAKWCAFAFWFAAWHLVNTRGAWRNPLRYVPGFEGDQLMFLWNYGWVRHALTNGSGGWWCDSIYYPRGFFFLFHTHTWFDGLLGAMTSPLLPRGPTGVILWYNLMQLLATVATGLIAMATLRHWGVRRWEIQLLGATMISFSWFRTYALLGHQNFVGTQWMMAALWGMSRGQRLRRLHKRAAFAMMIGAGAFCGAAYLNDQTLAVFGALLCGLILVAALGVARRQTPLLVRSSIAALGFFAGFLFAASPHLIQILKHRGQFDYYVAGAESLRVNDITNVLLPGNGHCLFGPSMTAIREKLSIPASWGGYIGSLTVIVPLFAIHTIWRRRDNIRTGAFYQRQVFPLVVSLLLGLILLLFSFGDTLLVAGKQYAMLPERFLVHVPVLNHLRKPVRWIWPSTLLLTLSGCLAFQWRWGKRWDAKHGAMVLLLSLLAAIDGMWGIAMAVDAGGNLRPSDTLVAAIRNRPSHESIVLLPPSDNQYRALLAQLYWGYDRSLALGHCARPPLGGEDAPWDGFRFTAAMSKWLAERQVRTIVLYENDGAGAWDSWIKAARRAQPQLVVLNRNGKAI